MRIADFGIGIVLVLNDIVYYIFKCFPIRDCDGWRLIAVIHTERPYSVLSANVEQNIAIVTAEGSAEINCESCLADTALSKQSKVVIPYISAYFLSLAVLTYKTSLLKTVRLH